MVKSREAISSASPFLAALVAFAESWLYTNGVLCHIRGRSLRLLDIHNSADSELVVDIRKLLDEAIPESRGYKKYKFRLLYQAYGVVSCLYAHKRLNVEHWLVVFQPAKHKILTTRRLGLSTGIFVRNNSRFLYYGTQSDVWADQPRRWVLQGFSIESGDWFDKARPLPGTVGSEIGTTVCFEIIDEYFYVLANTTAAEVRYLKCHSYYDFYRFPLACTDHQRLERPPLQSLFRRHHVEGPIDDRWTVLKIFKDETSGTVRILESRKEWYSGSGSATRTCYTKTFNLGHSGAYADGGFDIGRDTHSDEDRCPPPLGTVARDMREVHVGDDGSKSVMFTLSKCFIRSYHPGSQTFLDLVDDPDPAHPTNQRLRVRAATRRLSTRSEPGRQTPFGTYNPGSRQTQEVIEGTDGLAERKLVTLWPHDDTTQVSHGVHRILNPPGYHGNVHGIWDDRAFVYATGGVSQKEDIKALVLVSFDPGISLKGVQSIEDRDDVVPGNVCDLSSTRPSVEVLLDAGKSKDEGKKKSPLYKHAMHEEGCVAEHSISLSSGSTSLYNAAANPTSGSRGWVTVEMAQYLKIGQGFHFAS